MYLDVLLVMRHLWKFKTFAAKLHKKVLPQYQPLIILANLGYTQIREQMLVPNLH